MQTESQQQQPQSPWASDKGGHFVAITIFTLGVQTFHWRDLAALVCVCRAWRAAVLPDWRQRLLDKPTLQRAIERHARRAPHRGRRIRFVGARAGLLRVDWQVNGDEVMALLILEVRVRPLCPHGRRVGAVLTWSAWRDKPVWETGGWLRNNAGNDGDEVWTIQTGICAVGAQCQFAVFVEDDGIRVWDNNGGANYRLMVEIRRDAAKSPPRYLVDGLDMPQWLGNDVAVDHVPVGASVRLISFDGRWRNIVNCALPLSLPASDAVSWAADYDAWIQRLGYRTC